MIVTYRCTYCNKTFKDEYKEHGWWAARCDECHKEMVALGERLFGRAE
jgi:hypothetical protein